MVPAVNLASWLHNLHKLVSKTVIVNGQCSISLSSLLMLILVQGAYDVVQCAGIIFFYDGQDE